MRCGKDTDRCPDCRWAAEDRIQVPKSVTHAAPRPTMVGQRAPEPEVNRKIQKTGRIWVGPTVASVTRYGDAAINGLLLQR